MGGEKKGEETNEALEKATSAAERQAGGPIAALLPAPAPSSAGGGAAGAPLPPLPRWSVPRRAWRARLS